MNDERTGIFLKRLSENRGIIHKVCNVYCNNSEEKKDLMQEFRQECKKLSGVKPAIKVLRNPRLSNCVVRVAVEIWFSFW